MIRKYVLTSLAVAVVTVIAIFQGSAPAQIFRSQPFTCSVSAAIAITQCQGFPQPATGRHAITAFYVSNGATAQTVQLVSGTGTACATGQVAVTPVLNIAANDSLPALALPNPVYVTAGHAVCCKPGGATAFSCMVQGFTVP